MLRCAHLQSNLHALVIGGHRLRSVYITLDPSHDRTGLWRSSSRARRVRGVPVVVQCGQISSPAVYRRYCSFIAQTRIWKSMNALKRCAASFLRTSVCVVQKSTERKRTMSWDEKQRAPVCNHDPPRALDSPSPTSCLNKVGASAMARRKQKSQ